jgi:hypothetical protein
MQGHRLAGFAVFGAAAAIAFAASAQSETTVIHERKVVPAPAGEPAPPPPAPVQATVVHKHTVISHVVTTSGPAKPRPVRVVHKAPPPKPRTTVLSQSAQAQSVTEPAAPSGDQLAASSVIDRKTVIHRDADGGVTRHTVIEKQDPNGDKTVIDHRSAQPADEPPAPPPSPGQLRA